MEKIKPGQPSNVVRFGVLLSSILFIGIGIMKQEQIEVLQKAVKICLECIGIGESLGAKYLFRESPS